MLNQKLMGKAGEEKQFIEDLFSTYLYTGNGTSQTINNGIDLAGKGGMVWEKVRNQVVNNYLVDTARGGNYALYSNTTGAQGSGAGMTFNSTGYSWATSWGSTQTVASWTFRKAPKFFDVVTYTGNGVAGRQIPHSLGVAPGMIVVKCTSGANNWAVYHRSTGNSGLGYLNLTVAFVTTETGIWANTAPTSTSFSVGQTAVGSSHTNASGVSYVAYLFAHDTTADGLIQCGSVTLDGTATYQDVNLGWEAQYVLTKRTDLAANWFINDNMRGMPVDTNSNLLFPNTSGAEASSNVTRPTATGFRINNQLGGTYIYMAIRRGPMRTPTDGTKVFQPVARTGTGANATVTAGFPVDMYLMQRRPTSSFPNICDRLRGKSSNIQTYQTDAESTTADTVTGFDNMTAVAVGADAAAGYVNTNGITYGNQMFKRAPGFFDVVCYTGNNTQSSIPHSLGVAPNFIILKCRSSATEGANGPADWFVAVGASTSAMHSPGLSDGGLNKTNALGPAYNLSAYHTASSFSPWYLPRSTVSGDVAGNGSGRTYVAYLFASCPGVSKVGTYTGNGSSQTINCGFTAGARFVLIKRTNSTGDWYVWDTARGIVAGNDPHLSLNTTAAEVTSDDTIDPDSSGFIVNQVAATNVNVNAATYIYLAIA